MTLIQRRFKLYGRWRGELLSTVRAAQVYVRLENRSLVLVDLKFRSAKEI
jgi:hypothetical protein